jgi:transposase InsO family protein
MTKHYPQEFRDDVLRVDRLHQISRRQVALDFGISAATLYKWLGKAEIKQGLREVMPTPEQVAENRMTSGLALSALHSAIILRRPKATICHSDRGSQFRSGAFTSTLKNNGLCGSMGRVGTAGDNARMESFHSLLQNNVLDSKKWESQEELRIAIVTWIERTYHRRRRKRGFGKMTPVEYEVAAEAVDKELLVA